MIWSSIFCVTWLRNMCDAAHYSACDTAQTYVWHDSNKFALRSAALSSCHAWCWVTSYSRIIDHTHDWVTSRGISHVLCCSVLQCVAACCSVLQCVAVSNFCCSVLQCVAACCSVLQCVAVSNFCCSVLQCVAACCSVLQRVAVRGSLQLLLQYSKRYRMGCGLLQCVAAVLQSIVAVLQQKSPTSIAALYEIQGGVES